MSDAPAFSDIDTALFVADGMRKRGVRRFILGNLEVEFAPDAPAPAAAQEVSPMSEPPKCKCGHPPEMHNDAGCVPCGGVERCGE